MAMLIRMKHPEGARASFGEGPDEYGGYAVPYDKVELGQSHGFQVVFLEHDPGYLAAYPRPVDALVPAAGKIADAPALVPTLEKTVEPDPDPAKKPKPGTRKL